MRVSTLILLHRSELLRQWREQLQSLFLVGDETIGSFGRGRTRLTGKIDIALAQSVSRHGEVNELVEQYGQVIVDECHHVGAVSFEAILNRVRARYVVGLTATPFRRDGHQPVVFMQCGPVRFVAKGQDTQIQRREVRPKLIPSRIQLSPDASIQDVFKHIAQDQSRTKVIAVEAIRAFRAGRKVLVLTERTEHLAAIEAALQGRSQSFFSLHGRLSKRQRLEVLQTIESLPGGAPRVLVATGRLIGEGFDHPPLDTLVLAMPISWKGTLQQYVGRLQRFHEQKTDLQIIDLIDSGHPSLARMWQRRQTGYRALGYVIDNSDSASQGSLLPEQT